MDAMTFDIPDDRLEAMTREAKPDLIVATAITPASYKAIPTPEMYKRVVPDVPTAHGGVHGTFTYRQEFSEATWIDVIVRGEGKRNVVNVAKGIKASS